MALISNANLNNLDQLNNIIIGYQNEVAIDNIVIAGNQLTQEEYKDTFGSTVALIGTLVQTSTISSLPEATDLIEAQANIISKVNTGGDISSADVLDLLTATTVFLEQINAQEIALPIHELKTFSITLELLTFTYNNRGLVNDWVELELTNYEQNLIYYKNNLDELINDFWSNLQLDPTIISESLNDIMSSDFTLHLHSDPLVLDLDGDGLETITTNGNQSVMFDHNGDGVKYASGWVSSDDGFLVIDKNNNGTIDNGAELFGDSTMLSNGDKASDGFAALADIDSNADGIVDANDTQFANLQVWRDLNQDGISQANELFTLADVNIQSFNLSSETNNVALDSDNTLSATGLFSRTDGSTNVMGDINLGQDTNIREFIDPIIIPSDIAGLPNMQGNGSLRDLREAATLSSNLATQLTDYTAATTKAEQESMLNALIDSWVDTALTAPRQYYDNVSSVNNTQAEGATHIHLVGSGLDSPPASSSELVDVALQNKLDAIELIGGVRYPKNFSSDANIRAQQIEEINTSYDLVSNYVYTSLVFQTRFNDIANSVNVALVDGELKLDLTEMESELRSQLTLNGDNGIRDVVEFAVMNFYSDKKLNWDGIEYLFSGDKKLIVTNENKNILSALGIITTGENENSTLMGSSNADILIGNSGTDGIYGWNGDDVLSGGTGFNDLLNGGLGNDTYLFSIGDGNTRISNNDSSKSSFDVLKFSNEIQSDNVKVSRSGIDLNLTIQDSGEVVTIRYYFYSDASQGYALDAIEFKDGTTWDEATIKTLLIQGTSGNDQLLGYETNDTIEGGLGNDGISGADGNDTITGGAGDDLLFGNAGSDTLAGGSGTDAVYGGAGDDTLSGGTGNNDFLNGNIGNDIYLFSKGDGDTRVSNYDTVKTSFDVLKFSSDISSDEVSASRELNNLILSVNSTNEKITIENYFYQESIGHYILDEIQFSDGTIWDLSSIKSLVAQSDVSENSDIELDSSSTVNEDFNSLVLNGKNNDDTLTGMSGNDKISGGSGDDYLAGGAGTDAIFGGNGNDILSGGTGNNDFLSGGSGNDTYLFSLGDGNTTISNFDIGANRRDVLKFSANITSNDVSVTRDNNNLKLAIISSNELITIENYFYADAGAGYALNAIKFSDGTSWDVTTINRMVTQGSSENNTLIGSNGNDTLIGNEGSDKLIGRAGDDSYFFNRGDGQDTIIDSGGENDRLEFGGDINNNQLWFSQNNTDLNISIIGTNENIVIENWYSNTQNRVEKIEASGMVLVDTQVQQLVSAMASFTPPAAGELTLSDDLNASLSPILTANWQ